MSNTADQKDAVTLRWLTPQSAEYERELDLRYRVLRSPLGMPRGSECLEDEYKVWHLVALRGQEVVGCVLCLPDEVKSQGRLLQMAVDPALRGQGVGRDLVMALEVKARGQGLSLMVMHAREVAFPFYEKLGYTYDGDLFIEVGIPHRVMKKEL